MKHLRHTRFTVLFLIFCFFSINIQAAIVHDESVNGDISDDNLNPTALITSTGSNQVIGQTTSAPLDRDFFTFTISTGHELVAIILTDYATTDDRSFLGIEAGDTLSDINGSGLLGWSLIGADAGKLVGDNLLDDIAGGPLGVGSYTLWTQETAGDTSYNFDLQISAVPIPAALPLMLSALAGLGYIGRKTQRIS